jgi:UbiD family decarboxylase
MWYNKPKRQGERAMELREFLSFLRTHGLLREVEEPLSPYLELARFIAAHQEEVLLFKNVPGYAGEIVSGLCAKRELMAMALGVQPQALIPTLVKAMQNPVTPPIVENPPCQEVVEEKVDLTKLPILKHLAEDGGPYVTAGVAIIKDPDYGRNASFHRLMLLDEKRFVARVVEGRGTHTAWSKVSGDLEIAVAIGLPVHILIAASMSPPKGVDELSIANALAPTPLARCLTKDLEVPACAEIVLEGRLTKKLAPEGPFIDLTQTWDYVREQPILEVDLVTHRKRPIYHALLPGGAEHRLLMGIPREPTIFSAVNEVAECLDVRVTPGGMCWLHAVVKIRKRGPEDGLRAIEAAFKGHPSLKHVVIVDEDVDIDRLEEVEWAIATRFQADRGLVVLRDQPGSSLDPSAKHTPGRKTLTAKMGIDATIPWGAKAEDFKRIRW